MLSDQRPDFKMVSSAVVQIGGPLDHQRWSLGSDAPGQKTSITSNAVNDGEQIFALTRRSFEGETRLNKAQDALKGVSCRETARIVSAEPI